MLNSVKVLYCIHRVSEKNKQNYFCYNYVKFPPNLTIFGTKMANSLKLYEVHSFSTSTNSRQCTTVLNADIPNYCMTSVCTSVFCGIYTIQTDSASSPHWNGISLQAE